MQVQGLPGAPQNEPRFTACEAGLIALRCPLAPLPLPPAMKPPWERHDSTDHRDCAENRDPVLSHEPVEISDSEDPIEPADRALPIEPTDRTDPTDPTESTDPTDPIDSRESLDHNDSTDPEGEAEEEEQRPDGKDSTDGMDGFVIRPSCP